MAAEIEGWSVNHGRDEAAQFGWRNNRNRYRTGRLLRNCGIVAQRKLRAFRRVGLLVFHSIVRRLIPPLSLDRVIA